MLLLKAIILQTVENINIIPFAVVSFSSED